MNREYAVYKLKLFALKTHSRPTLGHTKFNAALTVNRKQAMPAKSGQPNVGRRFPKTTPPSDVGTTPTQLIDARIAELQDWRGEVLSRVRTLIRGADAEITEEWKWNTPVWSCIGIICTGETYNKTVKLTFPKGASLPDPSRLFNSSLEGNVRRAIDFQEGSQINEAALQELVQRAVTVNKSSIKGMSKGAS